MNTKTSKTATTLSQSVLGTDALSIAKLFSIDGWVAVGQYRPSVSAVYDSLQHAVTGGGTGLGLITAAALAANGAKVYITGRRLEALESGAKEATPSSGKGRIIPIQADVSTKEGIAKLRDEIKKNEKFINLLVNNHGISLSHPNFDNVGSDPEKWSTEFFNDNWETWDETYRINCSSYHFTTMAFLGLLSAAKSVGKFPEPGNVVNISSISGAILTSQRGQFNYNTSKAGTIQLSRMMATEFARRDIGVRVNCILPGYFPSGMSVLDYHEREGEEAKEHFKTTYGTPMGRVGEATDYAQTIFGLVTNKFMTGVEIQVDGGWMLQQSY